jgi:ubiquinone/menaquinone biosynthesis C-methylase UbiE
MQNDPQGLEIQTLCEFVNLDQMRVLEIGCGSGRLTWLYVPFAQSVTGGDPAFKQLVAAQQECPARLRPKLTLAQLTAKALPFVAESFEVAILSWSL